jgi:hypothetical protein
MIQTAEKATPFSSLARVMLPSTPGKGEQRGNRLLHFLLELGSVP